jgi:hypothetical protein
MEQAAREAAQLREEQEYLAWARRVIDSAGWNRKCHSARCRRHGCRNASRCEPRWHDSLHLVLAELTIAELREVSPFTAKREGPNDASERRALLAEARRRGTLPLPFGGETDAPPG